MGANNIGNSPNSMSPIFTNFASIRVQTYNMTENQEPQAFEEIEKPRIWYVLQFISLILMALIGGALFAALAIRTCSLFFGVDGMEALTVGTDFSNRSILYAHRYIQVLSSIGTFAFASVAQLAFMRVHILSGTGVRIKINPIMAGLSILLVFTLQPAISFIANWCLGWTFPPEMAEIETQLRQLHETAVNTQFAFLKDQGPLDLAFNLFMMAALPAFCEELFFRRVGLRILYDITGNPHVSIAISALLFAMVHGQFFYLIPLFIFGMVLGYLALWSRSLWLPVLAHFTNNAFALIATYFAGDEVTSSTEPDFGQPVISFVVSILLSAAILLLLKRREANTDGG